MDDIKVGTRTGCEAAATGVSSSGGGTPSSTSSGLPESSSIVADILVGLGAPRMSGWGDRAVGLDVPVRNANGDGNVASVVANPTCSSRLFRRDLRAAISVFER